MPRVPVNQPYSTAQSIPFGDPDPNAKYGRHAGTDLAVEMYRPVYATESGTITPYTWGEYHGNVVEIFDGKYYAHCLHLDSVVVKPGQKVKKGDLIGYAGQTGKGVSGPHVHFGVSKVSLANTTSFNDFINPNDYLNGGIMNDKYDTVPYGDDVGFHYRNRVFREATDAEKANKDGLTWAQILDDNVAELGKRLVAAEQNQASGKYEATNVSQDGAPLYKKKG